MTPLRSTPDHARALLVLLLPVASTLALAGTAACSSSSACTPGEGTLTVTVRNNDVDSNTNFICDATVTLSSATGGTATAFTPQGFDGSVANCVYVTNVAPGTYKVSTSATGFTPAAQTITVPAVDCVTNSPQVTVELFQSYATLDAGLADGG